MESKRRAHLKVFALKAWTVKSEKGKFFISPTACFDDKRKWRGPYRTLQHATTAIARKLGEEFNKRHKRLETEIINDQQLANFAQRTLDFIRR